MYPLEWKWPRSMHALFKIWDLLALPVSFFYWNSFKLTSNIATVMSKRRKSWVDPLFKWSTKTQRTVLSPVLGTGYHMQRMAKHVHKFQMYGEMYRGKVCWVTAHFPAHFFKSAHFTLFTGGLPRSHSMADGATDAADGGTAEKMISNTPNDLCVHYSFYAACHWPLLCIGYRLRW